MGFGQGAYHRRKVASSQGKNELGAVDDQSLPPEFIQLRTPGFRKPLCPVPGGNTDATVCLV